MNFTDEHLDSQDTYVKLRRAIIRIMGRAEPNVAQVASNMGVNAEELTQFIKRHLGSPSNLQKKDLDKLNLKFSIGVKDAPAPVAAVELLSAPRAKFSAAIPAPVIRRGIGEQIAAMESRRQEKAAPKEKSERKAPGIKPGSPEWKARAAKYAREAYARKQAAKRAAAGESPVTRAPRRARLAKTEQGGGIAATPIQRLAPAASVIQPEPVTIGVHLAITVSVQITNS